MLLLHGVILLHQRRRRFVHDFNWRMREGDYTPLMHGKPATHRETEIKLAIKDLPGLLARLNTLGLKPKGRVLERNSIFDTDANALRQRGMLLRLRLEKPARSAFAPAGPKRMVLTTKSPVPDQHERAGASQSEGQHKGRYKEKMEREVVLNDILRRPKRTNRTLRDRGWPFALGVLGFRLRFRYEKFRTSYVFQEARLELDETPVGVYLEIEGTPVAIDQATKSLGFGPGDYIRANYYQLYEADSRRRGRPVRHMLFPR